MKRLFDIILAFALLLLLMPLFFLIIAIILLVDGWPVFFIQHRVGKQGRIFKMFKFRSMTVKKEARVGSFDAGDTSRVTYIGKFLRKSKLDELPQLINVLIGDMSFVGPRPEVEKWTKVYADRWRMVLSVKPGITDNASLLFRNEEEILANSTNPQLTYKEEILPRKLDLYEHYVKNSSFVGDISIILKTVYSIFRH